MRISDWSSDVCSSDLCASRRSCSAPMPGMDHSAMGKSAGSRMASKAPAKQAGEDSHASHGGSGNTPGDAMKSDVTRPQLFAVTTFTALMLLLGMTFPAAFSNLDRTSDWTGTGVSVRVNLVGLRLI